MRPLATLWTASTGCLAVVLTLLVVSGTPTGAVASDPEASNLDEITRLLRAGRYADAERLATGLLKRIEADAGAESVDAANVLDVVVEARIRGGKSSAPETLTYAERAIRIKETHLGRDHSDVATSLNNLGVVLLRRADYAAAQEALERALAIRKETLDPRDPLLAKSLHVLGWFFSMTGESDRARSFYERALEIREDAGEPRDLAWTLNNLALVVDNDPERAKQLHERALAIREENLGPDHPDVAYSLYNLSSLYTRSGDYSVSRTLSGRVLEIREQSLGPDHPDIAWALINLSNAMEGLGDWAGARPLVERALRIFEAASGPDHPNVATCLLDLGLLLHNMSEFAEAKPMFERALAIREARFGPENEGVAWALSKLAWLAWELGSHSEAQPLFERSLAIYEAIYGAEHPRLIGVLLGLASNFGGQEEYDKEEELLLRALAISEGELGREVDVSRCLSMLAWFRQRMGSLEEARALAERALAIEEQWYGPDHPVIAETLGKTGEVLAFMGAYAEARGMMERAVSINEKKLGADSPAYALSLAYLAGLHGDLGSYTEAKHLYERALAIEEPRGSVSSVLPVLLNNIGFLHRRMGEFAQARTFFERALALSEAVYGPDHTEVAPHLSNLGFVLRGLGSYSEALARYERALTIDEKHLGQSHPSVGTSLRGMAGVLHDMGQYEKAQPFLERGLIIAESAVGPQHPAVARIHLDLADNLVGLGDLARALEEALLAETIGREHLQLTARALAENRALLYADVRTSGLDLALSLASTGAVAGASGRVWDALIQSRAVVLDEMARRHQTVALAGDLQITALLDRLVTARRHLANIFVRGPSNEHPEQYRPLLDHAREVAERAERNLADRAGIHRTTLDRHPPGMTEVVQSVPEQTAVVAYTLYSRHPIAREDANTGSSHNGNRKIRNDQDAVPMYAAFVLGADREEPVFLSLGPAEEIDLLIARWRDEAGQPSSESIYRSAGTELRNRVWNPVRPHLGGAREVLVVPDGALNLVNLGTFPTDGGRYQIEEELLIRYVSAERDLVRSGESSAQGNGLLVLGGAAFDDRSLFAALAPAPEKPDTEGAVSKLEGFSVSSASPVSPADVVFRGGRSSCSEFRTSRWAALPETTREAKDLTTLWRNTYSSGPASEVTLLEEAAASEAAFKQLAPGQRILHVATHGFFLGQRCKSALDRARGARGFVAAPDDKPAPVSGENPLLLSGLVLAGANNRSAAGPDEEDGILTAEEVAAMDLSGVELAVLSACDTGLGTVKAGEGVFGLRRAFWVAGVRTLVMSLWSVEDAATREWMTAFYSSRLGVRPETPDAIREASRSILARRRAEGESTHPFFWGAFVATGSQP